MARRVVTGILISIAISAAAFAQRTQADIDEANAPKDARITLPRPQLEVDRVSPVRFEKRGEVYFADFGSAMFGNLEIHLPDLVSATELRIRLGEKLAGDAIDRKPPGSVNFCEVSVAAQPGQNVSQLEIPLKRGYQRHKTAIKLPPEIGNITPFRYAEIEAGTLPLNESAVRHRFVHTAFDDNASSFRSSDETLNAVWDLCKHTMKATTAFGVYIDGDRERRPYEADAYINFLSHLACDFNPEVGRYSVEYLLAHPTWPTEWSFHMPIMAAADYEATGNTGLLSRNYEQLKRKLLMDRAREDGLLSASAIVDWPVAERDGYNDGKAAPDHKQQAGPLINTVTNAFYYHALQKMAVIARALNKPEDAHLYESTAKRVYEALNEKLFDPARGLYLDGEGSAHASLHANMLPLAFDLVPPKRRRKVADFVQSRGMACSVYGAQYLLEALYKNGRDDYALKLLTARDQRSWWNMIALGSTMTMEAWDFQFKPNSTWNHPWGAAPANIITRYLLGVRPLTPGYRKILIAPQPGGLKAAQGKVPTPLGPVSVRFQNEAHFILEVEVPPDSIARISLPLEAGNPTPRSVLMNGTVVTATAEDASLSIDNVTPGQYVFELQ